MSLGVWRYTYWFKRFHIPTNSESFGVVDCIDEAEFNRMLAAWNRIGFGVWQYSECSESEHNH
jgi:hypothetical protein